MADSAEIKEKMDGAIESWGDKAKDNIEKIVIKLIDDKCTFNFNEDLYAKCKLHENKTSDKLRDEILAQYFSSKTSKQVINKVSDTINLFKMAEGIIKLARNVKDVYTITTQYVNGEEVSPDEALSETFETLGSIISFVPGTTYVTNVLSLGNSILEISAQMVKDYVAQYEQLEAMIDGVEENGAVSESDATYITGVYEQITQLTNSGDIEVMNFAYGMLNDYGWFFDLCGADISSRVDVIAFNSAYTQFMNNYNQINSLMDEIAALDTDGNNKITVDEIKSNNKVFNDSQNIEDPKDPLILDLNRNGKFSTTTDEGVHFDYEGDGFAEKTAWMEDGDGLLVLDRNKNGIIDDGKELFGDKTVLSDGTTASNGFVALSELDTNNDSIIDKNDQSFADLRVWIDNDRNGISEENELYSLSELGIKSIDLKSTVLNKTDENGNVISRTSVVNFADNTVAQVGELNFNIITSDTIIKADIDIPDEILNTYPNLIATGKMLTLHQAMATDDKLYGLVTELNDCEDMTRIDAIINAIICRWTDTENVIEGSRGVNVDAMHLAVIEKFYGASFDGVNGANPNVTAGAMLEAVYEELRMDIANNLLMQTSLKTYCDATKFKERLVTGEVRIDYTDVIAMAEEEFATNKSGTAIKLHYYFEILRSNSNSKGLFDVNSFLEQVSGSEYEEFYKQARDLTILYGCDIAETIYGNSNSNVILGYEGNDFLEGESGNDTYIINKGDGSDRIYDSEGTDTIRFGEGISADDLRFERVGDDLIMTFGDQTLRVYRAYYYGGGAKFVENLEFADGTVLTADDIAVRANTRYGSDSSENIYGYGKLVGYDINETLYARGGDDYVYGYDGNDTLYGEAGVDSIYGGNGDDVIIGGTDKDFLEGDSGNDTYIINKGDGSDRIYDSEGTDTIRFGEGISADDLRFERVGDDLIMTFGDQTLRVYRAYYYGGGAKFVENLEFADGTVLTADDIAVRANTRYGSDSSENIYGYGKLVGYDINETLYARGGDDYVYGYDGNDTIYGEAGVDSIYGGNGDDVIIGGTGNDFLEGESGNDTYIINKGDGSDRIYDSEGTDTIRFGEGITAEDIQFERVGDDLIMTFGDQTLRVYRAYYYGGGAKFVENLEFADGTVLTADDIAVRANTRYGSDNSENIYGYGKLVGYDINETLYARGGDDYVYGYDGNDTLYGEAGVDSIYGGNGDDVIIGGTDKDFLEGDSGNDTYIINKGDGSDRIYDSEGTDTIRFGEGISADDLRFERVGDDLIMTFGDQTLRVYRAYYYGGGAKFVENLEFADGTVLTADDIAVRANTRYGSDNSENIYGYGKLVGYDINETLYARGGDDYVYGYDGNDTLYGEAGVDSIYGGNGDDVIIGGTDKDFLEGDSGNDTYIINKGDGSDRIYDSEGTDTIRFGEGITAEDIRFERVGDDLIMTFGDQTLRVYRAYYYGGGAKFVENLEFADGTVLTADDIAVRANTRYGSDSSENIYGYGKLVGYDINETLYARGGDDYVYGYDGNDTIYGEAGVDSIYGGNGDDVIIGGTGNDFLEGESGNDTYIINKGDGSDRIYDSEGTDTIRFGEGISADDLSFERVGDDLIMTFGDQTLRVYRAYYYGNGAKFVENLEFADGTVLTADDIAVRANTRYGSDNSENIYGYGKLVGYDINETLYARGGDDYVYGYDGNDTIYGETGVDSIYGGNGDDVIIGGTGNDFLEGESGNDTYIINKGDGSDRIYDSEGNDTIRFGEGISAEDLSFERVGDDLIMTFGDQTLRVYRAYYYGNGAKFVENIEFADGTLARIDSKNLSLIIEYQPEPVLDADSISAGCANTLTELISEESTEANMLNSVSETDACSDLGAALLAQELSVSETDNNVFSIQNETMTGDTTLFTEQYAVE